MCRRGGVVANINSGHATGGIRHIADGEGAGIDADDTRDRGRISRRRHIPRHQTAALFGEIVAPAGMFTAKVVSAGGFVELAPGSPR